MQKIIIKADGTNFTVYGSSIDSCQFVLDMKAGYMAEGVRHILRDECTEELLCELEDRFAVELQV